MTTFNVMGDIYSPHAACSTQIDRLPTGVFEVKKNIFGFYLEKIENFTLPDRLYGTIESDADRILTTFLSRPKTTGVLLHGDKGSGKSLMARLLALKAQKLGYPTIAVTTPFVGADFNTFIASITQPCVVLFDEFEKNYASTGVDENGSDSGIPSQEHILTLLDGIYTGKKLYIFTCNKYYQINENMKNRPGRIFYSLKYEGLSTAFVKEYCDSNLVNKAELAGVLRLVPVISPLTFDMLQGLVEEMNRFNEPALDALRMLNVTPPEEGHRYSVRLSLPDGKQLPVERLYNGEQQDLSPYTRDISIAYTDENRSKVSYARFSPSDIVKSENGALILTNSRKETVHLTLARDTQFSYAQAIR